MNEPRRLIDDETSPLAQRLLESGRAYRASNGTRLQTAAALGIGAAPLVASGKAAAAALITKVAVVGVLATGATVVAYSALSSAPEVDQPEKPAPAQAPAPAKQPSPEVAAPSQAAEEAVPVEALPRVAPPPAARPSGQTDALSEELGRLDGARKKLASGQASQAIAELDAYRRDFPRGRLRMEASVLRIEALAKAGRTTEARDSARRFLAQHPNSVLAARVKRYAGE